LKRLSERYGRKGAQRKNMATESTESTESTEMINTVWQSLTEYQRYGMADTGLAPLSFM
jgi:hypothetical protein